MIISEAREANFLRRRTSSRARRRVQNLLLLTRQHRGYAVQVNTQGFDLLSQFEFFAEPAHSQRRGPSTGSGQHRPPVASSQSLPNCRQDT